FEGRPQERLVNHLMLRAMRQAQYAVDNIGHFGLAFDHYCHFTSPIRRYPDLLVHRAVHALLDGRGATDAYLEYAGDVLDEAATHSSSRERVAMEAERASVALKKVRFMRERVGEVFAGHVTGVAKYGLFVELDEIFVEGLVRADSIGRDDQYEYDEDRHAIVGRRSGRSFKLGDPVTVEVIGTSLERRQIDFRIARKA
ncbi:MAG TPA: RNB domain-containing ribonuclease, partial [bacterium]|nr:RNB domain-containing ribonuclease [bacterium]